MTAFADYTFYSQDYLCGRAAAIPQNSFPYYANKASAEIIRYTFDNITGEVPEAVKFCCCDLAEVLYNIDSSTAFGGVSSEKVGDVTVNYESGELRRQNLPKTVKAVVYSWLAGTGLLHRGGDLC